MEKALGAWQSTLGCNIPFLLPNISQILKFFYIIIFELVMKDLGCDPFKSLSIIIFKIFG